MVALGSELDAEIHVEGDVATLESPLPSLEGLPTLSSTCSTMARSDRPLPSTEAAALEAELGTEARAGEDVASLGTPLPSSEGLPASGSTPSMKARPGRPVPAQDEEQEAMEADSGGAAAEADGVDMGTVAVGGGGGLHAGRSLSDPVVGPTCPALAPAAGAPDPDPALAQFH